MSDYKVLGMLIDGADGVRSWKIETRSGETRMHGAGLNGESDLVAGDRCEGYSIQDSHLRKDVFGRISLDVKGLADDLDTLALILPMISDEIKERIASCISEETRDIFRGFITELDLFGTITANGVTRHLDEDERMRALTVYSWLVNL